MRPWNALPSLHCFSDTLTDPTGPTRSSTRDDNDLVICASTGGPLNPNNLYRNYEALIARAGVPRIQLRDLRHTHATLLLTAGTPIKAISERLGHAKTSITLDTYAHALPDMQDRAVDAIDAALA
jgi:integrase